MATAHFPAAKVSENSYLTNRKFFGKINIEKRKGKMTMNAIYFDMDGTIANLYGNPDWLTLLRAYDPTPYATATPLVNMNSLARKLNALRKAGWHIGIVSWLSKCSTADYDKAVTDAKLRWLDKHLHSVEWDEIVIVPYGTPKQEIVNFPLGILFDDEEKNRSAWNGTAYDVGAILETLRSLG